MLRSFNGLLLFSIIPVREEPQATADSYYDVGYGRLDLSRTIVGRDKLLTNVRHTSTKSQEKYDAIIGDLLRQFLIVFPYHNHYRIHFYK